MNNPPNGSLNNKIILKENYVYNSSNGLRKWREALAKVQSSGVGGTSALVRDISVIHDSIGEGTGIWSTGAVGHADDFLRYSWIGNIINNFTSKLGLDDVGRGLLHTYMINVAAGATAAPLWTFSGTWAREWNYGPMSTSMRTSTNGSTATINFNGTGVTILYSRSPVNATFTYSIDGGGAVTINSYKAAYDFGMSTTITGLSEGDHTLVITKSNDGANNAIIGIREIKGTKGIRVNRCGLYGATIDAASYPITGGDGPLTSEIDFWNPALTIIAMVANDFQGQTALATYKSQMQTVITRAKTFGDVMLLAYCPLDETSLTVPIPLSSYTNILRELSNDNNCCYLDLISKWGTYIPNLMDGYVHPNAAGHQAIANDVWNVLVG